MEYENLECGEFYVEVEKCRFGWFMEEEDKENLNIL